MLMKLSKLLVLSALWLGMAGSASAAIVDGVRQMPVPATTGFVASTPEDFETNYYYLYNVDAGLFFMEGNAWGTQVSVSTTGLKVAFTPDADYPLSYLFHDYSLAKNSWKLTFIDGNGRGGMFVDLGNQSRYRWGVEDNGATFRLYVASAENGNPDWSDENPAYHEGEYMGWDGGSDGVCSPYLTESEGNCINWAFVTPAEYDAYAPAVAIYNAAEALRKAILEYKEKGFDGADAYMAIYLNEAATLEELQQAKKDLDAAFVEWGKSQASVENPADLSGLIVNPTFDNANLSGWSGDAWGRGGTTADGAEHYSKNYNTYQKITGLTPGIYCVGVNGFYRSGNYGEAQTHWLDNDEASRYAKFYAKTSEEEYEIPVVNVMSGAQAEDQGQGDISVTYNDENGDPVTVYVPNTMKTGDYYFHTLHQYANKLYVIVDEKGELTLGVRKTTQIGGDWSLFDDFSLTFYGNGADAWQLFIDKAWIYDEKELDEDKVLFTQLYLDAYNAAATVDRSGFTTAEQILAAIAAVKAADADLQKNIDLWQQWQATVAKAEAKKKMLAGTDLWWQEDGIGEYINYKVEEIIEDRELTNEELVAHMEQILAWLEECEAAYKTSMKPGQDVTVFLQNPDFEDGIQSASNPSGLEGDYGTATGWHSDKRASGNFTPGPFNQPDRNHGFEAWHCWNFDLWQEVKDLPAGVYEIGVQGYVRWEGGGNAGYSQGANLYDFMTDVPVKVYLNNSLSDFKDVYSEQVDREHFLVNIEGNDSLPIIESWSWTDDFYPNSMGAAGLCFDWGMYKSSAFGLVKAGEPMRIGVKTVNMNSDWWVIWDNFTLTYQGFMPKYVKDALVEALKTLTIDPEILIGSDVRAKVEGLIETANGLIAEFDQHALDDVVYGEAMYNVLNEIYDAKQLITDSKVLFEKLDAARAELELALFDAEAGPVYDEADALLAEVENGLYDQTFTDAQAQEYLDKIAAMITKLAVGDYSTASDATPYDMTAAIKSASFEVVNDYGEKENSSEGWTNPKNLGNDDTQKGAYAMEAYMTDIDMYQDIVGLPAGTYLLEVDGFIEMAASDWQAGTQKRFEESYAVWQENPNATEAFLYATNSEGKTFSAGIANIMKANPLYNAEDEENDNCPDFLIPDVDGVAKVTITEGETTTDYLWPTSLVSGRLFLDMGKTEQNEEGEYVGDGIFTTKVTLTKGEGNLRVGLKKNPRAEGNIYWVVFDNFRLYYFGANSDKGVSDNPLTVESVAMGQPVKVEFFTLDGRKVNSLQKGIVIQKITLENGNIVVRKLRK